MKPVSSGSLAGRSQFWSRSRSNDDWGQTGRLAHALVRDQDRHDPGILDRSRLDRPRRRSSRPHDPYIEIATARAVDRGGIDSERDSGTLDRAGRQGSPCLGARVWLRRSRETHPGHRRHCLPRRLGFQALHRSGRHAARRARKARPRCARQRLSTGICPAEHLQAADHAPSIDVAPIGIGARAARRSLLRPGAAFSRARRAQPCRDESRLRARHPHEVLERGYHRRGCGRRKNTQ